MKETPWMEVEAPDGTDPVLARQLRDIIQAMMDVASNKGIDGALVHIRTHGISMTSIVGEEDDFMAVVKESMK